MNDNGFVVIGSWHEDWLYVNVKNFEDVHGQGTFCENLQRTHSDIFVQEHAEDYAPLLLHPDMNHLPMCGEIKQIYSRFGPTFEGKKLPNLKKKSYRTF